MHLRACVVVCHGEIAATLCQQKVSACGQLWIRLRGLVHADTVSSSCMYRASAVRARECDLFRGDSDNVHVHV